MTTTITYRATNKTNGKWYVGSTIRLLSDRMKEHIECVVKDPFHNSLRKNPDNFIWEILSEVDGNDRSHEQEILDVWFGSRYCYNLSSAAVGWCSKIAAENGRKVMEKLWEDPEYRERHSSRSSERLIALWSKEDYREKMAEVSGSVMRELWEDPEFRRKKQEEASNRLSSLWEDPEFREKRIKEISNNAKKQWEDPSFREAMSETSRVVMNGLWEDPKFREAVSSSASLNMKKRREDRNFVEELSKSISRSNSNRAKDPNYTAKGYRGVEVCNSLSGEKMTFRSIEDAKNFIGVTRYLMKEMCNNPGKSHKGYTARYLED